ncbi:sensor histidine kinase [Facilibium subflavum]|uniref:sensor histidine kinase n=1 Tax=Facilibium subflavum TaxID=2219058 RepID=UPI000E6563E9|nr:ATP-binding protein [Facilibium subflavum]
MAICAVLLYHQFKAIVQNNLVKTMLYGVGGIFVLQLIFLSLTLSKEGFINTRHQDEFVQNSTVALFQLLTTSNLTEKRLIETVKHINNSSLLVSTYQVQLSLDKMPRYAAHHALFNNLSELQTDLKNHYYGFCVSYPIQSYWLNYCAFPEHQISYIVQLLSLINIAIFIFFLLYINVMTKVIFPIKKFQNHAKLAGQNLSYNPLYTNSLNIMNQTASSLNFMQTRMLQALHDKTKILGFISHDLRTPLTRIKMRLELNKADSPKNLADIDEMQKMINGILHYASEDRLMKEAKINTNIITLLTNITIEYQEINKVIRYHFPDKAIFLFIRPLNFKRAIVNILDNAFKYGNCVFLTCERSNNYIFIKVTDNGPGVKELSIDKLCQPFFQQDKSRPGSGLGLTITHEIIQDLHGKLSFYNQQQGGLCVEINIPEKYR